MIAAGGRGRSGGPGEEVLAELMDRARETRRFRPSNTRDVSTFYFVLYIWLYSLLFLVLPDVLFLYTLFSIVAQPTLTTNLCYTSFVLFD